MRNTPVQIGYGILSWDSGERISDRYGAIRLAPSNFEETAKVAVVLNTDRLDAFVGRKVKVKCVVKESRKSGHIGDLFHGIFPSQPDVGEEVVLGVGILQPGKEIEGIPDLVLAPNDGRKEFWIDPRKLYRLHDQTVAVYVETTDEDFTPSPVLDKAAKDEVISTGDGHVQGKTSLDGAYEQPKVEKIVDGLFMIRNSGGAPKGERFKIKKRN